MTVLNGLRAQLGEIGCRVELRPDGLDIVGQTDHLTRELLVETRRVKPALTVQLLREQAQNLVAFIDGEAPLAERQARLPELFKVQERLYRAQTELWASWRRDGFMIMWSPLVEEFIVVGDPPPPPGSEALVFYTWAEVEAMEDASPERVRAAHQLKKAFAGKVRA